jgi:hypothetical protein
MSYDRSLKAVNEYRNTVCNKSLKNLESALKGYTGMTEDQVRLYGNIYHYTKEDLGVCKTSNDTLWDPKPRIEKKSIDRQIEKAEDRLEKSRFKKFHATEEQKNEVKYELINFELNNLKNDFNSRDNETQNKLINLGASSLYNPNYNQQQEDLQTLNDFYANELSRLKEESEAFGNAFDARKGGRSRKGGKRCMY